MNWLALAIIIALYLVAGMWGYYKGIEQGGKRTDYEQFEKGMHVGIAAAYTRLIRLRRNQGVVSSLLTVGKELDKFEREQSNATYKIKVRNA